MKSGSSLNYPDKPVSVGKTSANGLNFNPQTNNIPLSRFSQNASGKSMKGINLRSSNTLEIPEMKKFTGKPLISLGNEQEEDMRESYSHLSMQQINEAVELANENKDATPHFINRNA